MAWYSCNIFLNSGSSGVLYTGDIVTGIVTFVFKSKKKIKHFDCRVVGISNAQWTRPSPTVPFIKVYSERRTILEVPLHICDHFIGKAITPGIETLKFHFTIPADLPSSYKSSIAKVRYFIKIESKAKCKSKTVIKFPFQVMGKVNLNHLQEFVTPSYFEFLKKFTISGQISMVIKTYTGFAPTQVVPFEVIICNEDRVKITKIKVDLIQKLKYTVSSGYADDEKTRSKFEININNDKSKERYELKIDIPPTIPSSIHVANPVVEISYIFRVQVLFPFHFSCLEEIPVTIATVPVVHDDCDGRSRLAQSQSS